MRSLRSKGSRLFLVLIASLVLVALTACASTPQDILTPFSPAAAETANLFLIVFWAAVLIFILVEGLLVWFVFRYQRRAADEHPEQYHGNTRLEITWTIIPALILVVVFALTIRSMISVGPTNPPGKGTPLRVVGHQWWWEIQYPDAKVITATELHMPAGQVMNLVLNSDNVIHSFWVPSIMGKTDVVPGHDNTTWLLTDQLGTYHGQCAEFCGTQHANMLFRVVVQSPADFQAWLTQQQQPPVEPAAGSVEAQGKAIFLNPEKKCIGCHTINGTNALGVTGPNLTHIMTRSCFAGCMFQLTHDNLTRWLTDAQAMKPGSLMKNYGPLTPDDIVALTAYLESLK